MERARGGHGISRIVRREPPREYGGAGRQGGLHAAQERATRTRHRGIRHRPLPSAGACGSGVRVTRAAPGLPARRAVQRRGRRHERGPDRRVSPLRGRRCAPGRRALLVRDGQRAVDIGRLDLAAAGASAQHLRPRVDLRADRQGRDRQSDRDHHVDTWWNERRGRLGPGQLERRPDVRAHAHAARDGARGARRQRRRRRRRAGTRADAQPGDRRSGWSTRSAVRGCLSVGSGGGQSDEPSSRDRR